MRWNHILALKYIPFWGGKEKEYCLWGEEEMERGCQEMGIPLLKWLRLGPQAEIETCRWEIFPLPPLINRSFQYPIWKTFQYCRPKHWLIFKGLLIGTIRPEAVGKLGSLKEKEARRGNSPIGLFFCAQLWRVLPHAFLKRLSNLFWVCWTGMGL